MTSSKIEKPNLAIWRKTL